MRLMLALALLALLALSGGLAACGSAQEEEAPFRRPTTAAATAPETSPPSDPDASCESQGIDTRRLREGACTIGGVHYVVANRTTPLKLRDLTVTVEGITADASVGDVQPEHDGFARVELTVVNRGRSAQQFTLGQTLLGVGDNDYRESVEAERADPKALTTADGGVIGAGERKRGVALFDVSAEDLAAIGAEGRLFVANFGADASSPTAEGQLGQIRLYAAPASAPPLPAVTVPSG